MDDPRMDEIYEYCSAHRLPVCMHVNPIRPGFTDEFVVLLERHPQLLVNAPHWILSVGRRERLVELLEVFPNIVTDISFGLDDFLIAGLRRISRTSLSLRHVVEQYPDRFFFGTDLVVTSAPHKTSEWMHIRVQAYLSMLSCKQYETPLIPSEILNGLNLPTKVLEQISSRNYLAFRSPSRILRGPARPVEWSRMGVPRSTRSPGQRLGHSAASDQ
jgi:predicted TIM-barrel fold metal-dependent hydrolase